jgi:hypothetical protein
MQVSANADTVSVADIVYLGAQDGGSDGVAAAATSSSAGTGVRIRIRSFQRPPAISHVVVGPWCTWPILSPTGDPYCTSGFINVVGGETASPSAISVGAVISSEQIAAVPEQKEESVVGQAPIKQSIHNEYARVEAASDGQCSADSRPVHIEQRKDNSEPRKSTEYSKKPNTKQGNKRKQKQKQRKQKREAEEKTAAVAAALAASSASVNEDVACHEQEKTDEQQQQQQPDGDVTQKESSRQSEIYEERRKTEETMCEPVSDHIETDRTDLPSAVRDATHVEEQLNVNEAVLLTDIEEDRGEASKDDDVVLVMLRQMRDDASENGDAKKSGNLLESGELIIESSGDSILHSATQTVSDHNTKNRKSKKRGRKKKDKLASDNDKEKPSVAVTTPVIISDVADDLAYLPRERLSSCSSLSSSSDSIEENKVKVRLPVKRTYYFTPRNDCDVCSDSDVVIGIETKKNEDEHQEKDDYVIDDAVSNTSEEEDEEKENSDVEEDECCESLILDTRDRATPVVEDDEDNRLDDSSSRSSSDTEGYHPDGHFSTVFVVNSSSDGDDSGAEDTEHTAVCLTKIKPLSEDDLVTVTESRLGVEESAETALREEDKRDACCLDTLENESNTPEGFEDVGGAVLLSHRVCQDGAVTDVSEHTVHETESFEPKQVTETVLYCGTEVTAYEPDGVNITTATVPTDKVLLTVLDNETAVDESLVTEKENEYKFMNEPAPQRLITDVTVPDREEEQNLGSNVNVREGELHPVADSVLVQETEEGDGTDPETPSNFPVAINESQDVDMTVPSANESALQVDAEEVTVLIKQTDLNVTDCNKLEHQDVQSDSELCESSDLESPHVPVISADSEFEVVTDKPLKMEENDETFQLSAACDNEETDTASVHLNSDMDCIQLSVQSVSEVLQFPVDVVAERVSDSFEDKQYISGLCHSEDKEVEEVEESVFVDEPCDGDEEEDVESDVSASEARLMCEESNKERVISTEPVSATGEEVVCIYCKDGTSGKVNSVCYEDEEAPVYTCEGFLPVRDNTVPDGSVVSMEICSIDPVSTAASGSCTEGFPVAYGSQSVLQSDEITLEITEDITKEVEVNNADLCGVSAISLESPGVCNRSHVPDCTDLQQRTAEPALSADSLTAGVGNITGTPVACVQQPFTESRAVEHDGTAASTEDGDAAFNGTDQDVAVLHICKGDRDETPALTVGEMTVAVDEKIIPIDVSEQSANVCGSPIETITGDVVIVEEEEIRSTGDPVMLTTALQSADSASVAGEDQLQGVSCLVVTEAAAERDACDPPSGEPRYTSLVMITQNHLHQESMVSVVTSETTTLVPADVIVRHTNWEEDGGDASPVENTGGLAGYFTLTLETSGTSPSCKRPLVTKTRPQVIKKEEPSPVSQQERGEEDLVKVVTGGDTLSAVVCLEEGLADDDSWVEELDNTGSNHEDEEFATTTPTEEDSESGDEATVSSASAASSSSSSYSTDREEELRGYHRSAIDFTLHTIVEESCEDSEVEQAAEEKGKKQRPTSASELEKYFFYGLGGGAALGSPPGGCGTRELDSFSDTCSSIYSEGLESLGADEMATGGVGDDPATGADDGTMDPAELASSRLEKYFLTGFMGFPASDHNNRDSDGSGSVGSDSEGRPSPEQRRKKLVRARGTGRQHSSSLDNLVSGELSGAEQQQSELQESEDSSSTETDTHHEDGGSSSLSITASGFEKPDGQFDTVKRKKKKRSVSSSAGGRTSPASLPSLDDKKDSVSAKSPVGDTASDKILASSEELSTLGVGHDDSSTTDDEGCKTPQPEFLLMPASELSASRNKQQSRDSGFIGSCDDLLKEQRTGSDSSGSSNNNDAPSAAPAQKSKQASTSSITEELKKNAALITSSLDAGSGSALPVVEEGTGDSNKAPHVITTSSIPPATALTRKDSFNNWSSDEETNLMMSKMRAFFKTMVAASSSTQGQQKTPQASPSTRQRGTKPPQLVYFENELTRLMKTVPGIRDEQVREIVEYLSSEDTWSDSYDSSDYTSSDLEGAYYMQQQGKVGAGIAGGKSELQEQISASCQQIISKFDTSLEDDDDHEDKGGGLNRDTAFVYQRLVASFSKMAADQQNSNSDQKGNHSPSSDSTPYSSPPLIAKVMHHIGSRLVALMHEVSGGEGLGAATSSPKVRYHHHRRLQAKLSAASTTTDDDSHTDTEQSGVELPGLPRSKSHDVLLEPGTRPSGVSSSMELATSEEREASDYERFSWRGSFESALMAADSRTKLSLLQDSNNASSTTALAAKRRSAGDLLFAGKSCSREQLLDRVRSCGSIGGSVEDKIWNARRRRSSVPDANTCHAGSGTSADGDDDDDTDDDDDDSDMRSTTLPRSLQTSCSAGTNSLPRLPTSTTASPAPSVLSTSSSGGIYKSHSVQHFGQGHVKSARYRPPGFSRPAAPKRTVSAPGLQPLHPSRSNRGEAGRRNRLQSNAVTPTSQVSGKWILQGYWNERRLRLCQYCAPHFVTCFAWFTSLAYNSYIRGPFAKFVDLPYNFESELCGGAVTVSFSK